MCWTCWKRQSAQKCKVKTFQSNVLPVSDILVQGSSCTWRIGRSCHRFRNVDLFQDRWHHGVIVQFHLLNVCQASFEKGDLLSLSPGLVSLLESSHAKLRLVDGWKTETAQWKRRDSVDFTLLHFFLVQCPNREPSVGCPRKKQIYYVVWSRHERWGVTKSRL